MRLPFWPLAVAGWWVAQEAVRDRFPWGGFPWGRLAMSQASAPTAGWATVGGLPVLTFLLALTGACLAYLVITSRASGQCRCGTVGRHVTSLRSPRAAGAARQPDPGLAPGPGADRGVATIQGDVPHSRNLPDQLRAHGHCQPRGRDDALAGGEAGPPRPTS